ncbi:hypothetical protein BR93DRAFT_880370 [Coniochaeta sp. PMI_546]|nr:hypothetical protein BR93DRAFT_880370 [Coniochaeta sp. PMI_546]
MGTASRVVSVVLRFGELTCSVIVLGLLGRFLSIVSDANVYADSRIIYATVVASMGVLFSILFILPFTYSFMAFPLDFVMFVLALVAFCLLEVLTGTNTCHSSWYWSYWGYYWGGFWRTPTIIVSGPSDINFAGCGSWKAVLAWTFIMSIAFLISSFLVSYFRPVLNHKSQRPNQI